MKLDIVKTKYVNSINDEELVTFTEFQYNQLLLKTYNKNNIFIFERKQNKKTTLLQKILNYIFKKHKPLQ